MNNASNMQRHCADAEKAVRILAFVGGLAAAIALTSCQSGTKPSFPANPTDTGSRYSDFGLPGSNMDMQNTDLED